VQRLEADGLVRRTDNPNDGRSVLAEITDAGHRLVEECTDRLNTEVFAAVPIPLGQQERAFKALKGVRKAFGDFT
jgi:DNA-binding MarR family transcriptional regulator